MEVFSILACVWPFVCWMDLLLLCIRLNCCFQRVVMDFDQYCMGRCVGDFVLGQD